MFEVFRESEMPEVYCLRDNSSGSEARVSPHRGGMLLRLTVAGREVFYLDRETFDDPSKNVRGGMPLLFPICGPLQEGRYVHEGVSHSMNQHGFARIRKWRAMETSTSESACITVELESDRETQRAYPWDFRLDYTYTLKGRTLRLEQLFKNNSETAMPLQFGLHPYFLVGSKEKLELDIPATRYQDTQNWQEGTFEGKLPFHEDAIDWVFLDVSQPEASLRDPVRGLKTTLRFDQAYKYLTVWTLRGHEFVCLEPWSARRFAMNTGHDLVYVAPGDTFKTWVEIESTPLH